MFLKIKTVKIVINSKILTKCSAVLCTARYASLLQEKNCDDSINEVEHIKHFVYKTFCD